MRSFGTTVAVVTAGLLFITQFAQASSDEAQLQQMQERITNLENQLENGEQGKDSFVPSASDVKNSLSSMLENTSIDSWVALSYNYNFEGFDNSKTGLANPTISSLHSTNSFQLDQAWISIDNQATEDSRGGAHLDYEWGIIDNANASGKLFSAYVSYLAPVANGVNIDLGLIPTLIGAEVIQTNANFNVTRGLVWELQPTTNVGAVFSTDLGGGLGAAVGVLNDAASNTGNGIADDDKHKAVTAQLSYAADDWSALATINTGRTQFVPATMTTPFIKDHNLAFYDLVLTWDGSDNLSTWINYTVKDEAKVGATHGIAAAGRYAVSDDLGVALRGEVTIFNPNATFARPNAKGNDKAWSITTTSDYALTDHLQAKVEFRVDINKNGFPNRNTIRPTPNDVSELVLAQAIYTF